MSTRAIQQIIEQGFGEGSSNPLSRATAAKVIEHLRKDGWIAPDELAMLVEAAGGEIIVTEESLSNDAPMLIRQWDEMNHQYIFRSTRKAEC